MKVSKEAMKDMYLRMVRIREFESKAQSLFADGKIPGFVHLYLGEEAVATGVCECLRDDDYITSTHRGHGHIVAKGGDLKLMMADLTDTNYESLCKALEEKNYEQANKYAENGIFLSLCSFVILFIFGLTGVKWFFASQTDIPAILQGGEDYLTICCCASFGLFG